MQISLSIASFPVDGKTEKDMVELLTQFETDYSAVLHASLWDAEHARGFTVLAYTEEEELIGFAAAADLVGLHHYEWSVLVHPNYRRHSIGTALADGIAHALQQRGAEEELAAFIEDDGAERFMESLGYSFDFKEIQLGATPIEDFELLEGITIVPYDGQRESLEELMIKVFDDDVLAVIRHNIEEDGRDIWLMKKNGLLVAAMTVIPEELDLWVTAFGVDPAEQGKGYGKEFLKWSRHYAFSLDKSRVLLDVEIENEALRFYEKAGFLPVSSIAYWKKKDAEQQ